MAATETDPVRFTIPRTAGKKAPPAAVHGSTCKQCFSSGQPVDGPCENCGSTERVPIPGGRANGIPTTQAAAKKKERAVDRPMLAGKEVDEHGRLTTGGRVVILQIPKKLKFDLQIRVAEVYAGVWWYGWACKSDVPGTSLTVEQPCAEYSAKSESDAIAFAGERIDRWLEGFRSHWTGQSQRVAEALLALDAHLERLLGSSRRKPVADVPRKSTAKAEEKKAGGTKSARGSKNDPPSVRTVELDVALIAPSKHNPRSEFDEKQLRLLGQSLLEKQIEPIAVRPDGDGYELLWGERRWRAARLVKKPTLRAEIHDCTDQEAIFLRGEENERREAFNPIEQARWYQQLLDTGMTQRDLAEKVGCEQAKISLAIGLLKLPEAWQRRIIARAITPTNTRALLVWLDRPAVLTAVEKELAKRTKLDLDTNLSAKEFERLVEDAARAASRPMEKATWDGGPGCHFTPTQKQRAELDCQGVKRSWGGTETRAFNTKLWNQLNNAAKARKKEKQAAETKGKTVVARGNAAKPFGPNDWQVRGRIQAIMGCAIADRLKNSDQETALRVLLATVNDQAVCGLAAGPGKKWVDQAGVWQWVQSLDRSKLFASLLDIARNMLRDNCPLSIEILSDLAYSVEVDPFDGWKPAQEDLDLYSIEALRKMPAAKASEYSGGDKAELIAAMIAHWTPGEVLEEFRPRLGKPKKAKK